MSISIDVDTVPRQHDSSPPSVIADCCSSASVVEPSAKRRTEAFPNRIAYLLTSVASVVGFGNWFKFPYLCAKFGGVNFLCIYCICLFIFALPLTGLEIGLGRITRGSILKAFNAIHPRTAAAGFGVLACFLTLCYYPLFITWSMAYLVNSFKTYLGWRLKRTLPYARGSPPESSVTSTSAAGTQPLGAAVPTIYSLLASGMRGIFNEECCGSGTIWRVPRFGMVILKYVSPLVSSVLFFAYISDPYAMYQYPRKGLDDPDPNFTPQLFLYSQLGPMAIMVSVIVATFIPEKFKPILPSRPVEFFFDTNLYPNLTPHTMKSIDKDESDDIETRAGTRPQIDFTPSIRGESGSASSDGLPVNPWDPSGRW